MSEPDGPEESEAAELEIERQFRRRLAGLDYLSPRDRLPARRAAEIWRRVALAALREKKAAERYAALMARRRQRAACSPSPS